MIAAKNKKSPVQKVPVTVKTSKNKSNSAPQFAIAQAFLEYCQACNSAVSEFHYFLQGYRRQKIRQIETKIQRQDQNELDQLETLIEKF